ncbi:MAG: sensor domain-containing diguanylate cyclase [Treponemataceae bacterium]|nr:sensor domain-containing diguanylate cyclase [Treponemataceae bacterium]
MSKYQESLESLFLEQIIALQETENLEEAKISLKKFLELIDSSSACFLIQNENDIQILAGSDEKNPDEEKVQEILALSKNADYSSDTVVTGDKENRTVIIRIKDTATQDNRYFLLYVSGLAEPERDDGRFLKAVGQFTRIAANIIFSQRNNREIIEAESKKSVERFLVDYKRYQTMLAAFGSQYVSIYFVDFDSDSFTSVKSDYVTANAIEDLLSDKNSYRDFAEVCAKKFAHPEEIERIAEATKPETVIAKLAENPRYSVTYHANEAFGKATFFEVQFISLGEKTGAHKAVMATRNIDEVMRQEYEQNQIIGSLSDIYFASYYIDLENNICTEIKTPPHIRHIIGLTCNADQAVKKLRKLVSTKDSADDVEAFTDLETLPQRLRTTKSTSLEFLCKDFGWCRSVFIKVLENDEGDATHVIYALQLIDQKKRRELYKARMLQKQTKIIGSIADIYTALFFIDLETDTYEILKTTEQYLKFTDNVPSAKAAMASIETTVYEDEFLEKVRTFCDYDTVAKRLKNVPYVSCEFHSNIHGWVQMNCIACDRDIDGNVHTVLFAIQDIDQNKCREIEINRNLRFQHSITKSFGEIYHSAYYLSLETNSFFPIKTEQNIEDSIAEESNLFTALKKTVLLLTHKDHVPGMLEFTDLDTLPQRIGSKHVIYHEFLSDQNRWFRASFISTKRTESGKVCDVIYTTENIDATKRQEMSMKAALQQALENQNAVYTEMLQMQSSGVLAICENSIMMINQAAIQMLGWNKVEDFESRYERLLDNMDESNRNTFLEYSKRNTAYICEFRTRNLDGTFRYIMDSAKTVILSNGQQVVLHSFIDITEKKQMEVRLLELSETDSLTGIRNRGSGEQRISQLLRNGRKGLFLIFDVDKFKSINDNYGHAAGDKVIVSIAHCMENAFRSNDVIMRLGGDEFSAFVADTDSTEKARNCIDRFFREVEEISIPELAGRKITVSLGGIICEGTAGTSFEEIYHQADVLMYRAKKEGGNRYVVEKAIIVK